MLNPNPITYKNLVYFVMEAEMDGESYIPCVAVENRSGYYRTDWRWKCDFATAQRLCAEKNEAMGFSPEAAIRIVLSTMDPVLHGT